MIEWCCWDARRFRFHPLSSPLSLFRSSHFSASLPPPSTIVITLFVSRLFNWIYNQSSRLMTIFRDLKFQFQIFSLAICVSPQMLLSIWWCRESSRLSGEGNARDDDIHTIHLDFMEVNAQATNYLLDWTAFHLICDSYSHSALLSSSSMGYFIKWKILFVLAAFSRARPTNLHKLHKWQMVCGWWASKRWKNCHT